MRIPGRLIVAVYFLSVSTNVTFTTVLGQCLDLLEDDDDASQEADDSKQETPPDPRS